MMLLKQTDGKPTELKKRDRCAKIVLNRQESVLTRLACMITRMALIYFFTTIISFRI